MSNSRGFTLIEVMIVVAIIAVLAAIAISQFRDYLIRSQIAEALSLADGAKSTVVSFYSSTGHFPAGACLSGNASVGLATAASISGSYVSSVLVAGEGCAANLQAGSILTIFSSNAPRKANSAINGAGLIFEPTVYAGSIAWQCKRFLVAGSVVLKDQWIPSSCR